MTHHSNIPGDQPLREINQETITTRTTNTVRRTSRTEVGPRPLSHQPIDYQTPDQVFPSLYSAVARIVQDCGQCSRLDLSLVPALSRYSLFQLERALLTAEHHGLLRRVGSLPPSPGDESDPDALKPGIYDVDPMGYFDRSNPNETVRHALANRIPLEITWHNPVHSIGSP